jgi:hypothetical protein
MGGMGEVESGFCARAAVGASNAATKIAAHVHLLKVIGVA